MVLLKLSVWNVSVSDCLDQTTGNISMYSVYVIQHFDLVQRIALFLFAHTFNYSVSFM